jgi:hypothetical protein
MRGYGNPIGHLHLPDRLARMRVLTPCLPVRIDAYWAIRLSEDDRDDQ